MITTVEQPQSEDSPTPDDVVAPTRELVLNRLADIMIAAGDVRAMIESAPLDDARLESIDTLIQNVYEETNAILRRFTD